MIATEDVLFVMPKDRELQFPAMAALQMYVNNYQVKCEANCVTPVMPTYKFRYWVDMPDEDWDLFQRLGIELKQQREQIAEPDSVIELNDDRLLSFYNSEKHCSQICSAISGVETPPYPAIRQVQCGVWSGWLMSLGAASFSGYAEALSDYSGCGGEVSFLAPGELLGLSERGAGITTDIVIGVQSWQTYAAAAMGLPVIEILTKSKSVNWLSKWKNPLYRVIEEDRLDRLKDTLTNLKEILQWQSSKVRADKDSATQTAATASTVAPVESTSATRT